MKYSIKPLPAFLLVALAALSTPGCGGGGGSSSSTTTEVTGKYRFTNLGPAVNAANGSYGVGVNNSGTVVVSTTSYLLDVIQNGVARNVADGSLFGFNNAGTLLISALPKHIAETISGGVAQVVNVPSSLIFEPTAINNEGDVVGTTSQDAVEYIHNGVATQIDASGESLETAGMNDASLIAGSQMVVVEQARSGKVIVGNELPVTLNPLGQVHHLALPAGVPGGTAQLINDSNVIVGSANGEVVEWSAQGQPTFMAPVTGFVADTAQGLNASGVVVGDSIIYKGTENLTHACIFSLSGPAIDLNKPGIVTGEPAGTLLTSAGAINDNGEIVGTATIDGSQVAYSLIPT